MSISLMWCFLHSSLLICVFPVVFPKEESFQFMDGVAGALVILSGSNVSQKLTNFQWKKDGIIIAQMNARKINIYDKASEWRLHISVENGTLTINPLIENDTGEYTFESLPPPWPVETHVIKLNVYEKIVSVIMHSDASYGQDNTNCTVTLNCIANGSMLELTWSKSHQKIPGMTSRETLVVFPIAGTELYCCTASNPFSSHAACLEVMSCQTHEAGSLYVLAVTGVICGLVLLVLGFLFKVIVKRKVAEIESLYSEIDERHIKGKTTKDMCCRQSAPLGDIHTCYDVLKTPSDICCNQSETPDVSTCYDVLKITSVPTSGCSTLYEALKSDHGGPTAAVTQGC